MALQHLLLVCHGVASYTGAQAQVAGFSSQFTSTRICRFVPNGGFDMCKLAVQAESPMEFYDIWVARDSDGNLFLKQTPYVTDPYSLDRIARGLPFPVKCCWNGLVILNSAPFLRHNVRVRCALIYLPLPQPGILARHAAAESCWVSA